MIKNKKILMTGLGTLAVSSVLAVSISCSHSGKETTSEANQKMVKSVTELMIQKLALGWFENEKDTMTAIGALAANTKRTAELTEAAVKGVKVTLKFEPSSLDETELTYEVTDVTKGTEKLDVAGLKVLNGDTTKKITGFQTQVVVDEKLLLATKAADVQTAVDELFTHLKTWTSTEAKNEMKTTKVELSNGVNVEFIPTDVPASNKISYVVTLISKGEAKKILANDKAIVEKLNGEITGFGKQTDQKAIVDAVTEAQVKKLIEDAFTPHKDKDVITAIAAVGSSLFLDKGVKISVSYADDDTNKKLEYTIQSVGIGSTTNTNLTGKSIKATISGFKFTKQEYLQSFIDGLKAEDILKEFEKIFANDKNQILPVALGKAGFNVGAQVKNSIEVKGVKVEFRVETGKPNGEFWYTIIRISKDTLEKVDPADATYLDKLDGKIVDFKKSTVADYEAIFNKQMETPKSIADIQKGINSLIDAKFLAIKSTKTVAEALVDVKDRIVEIPMGGLTTMEVTFKSTAVTADKKFTYTISEFKLGSFTSTDQTKLDGLKGEVTGFK